MPTDELPEQLAQFQFSAATEPTRIEQTNPWRRVTIAALLFAAVIGIPFVAFVMISYDARRDEAQREGLLAVSSMLKRFAAQHRRLPQLVGGSDNNVYSWRLELAGFEDVTVGPELNAVHREYDFTEPWDSAKNKSLVQSVQRFSGPHTDFGMAQYLAIKGDGTLWDPSESRPPVNAPLLISLPISDVAWMEPRDVVFKDSKLYFESKSGSLAEIDLRGIMVLWADDSITAISSRAKHDDKNLDELHARLRNKFVP